MAQKRQGRTHRGRRWACGWRPREDLVALAEGILMLQGTPFGGPKTGLDQTSEGVIELDGFSLQVDERLRW